MPVREERDSKCDRIGEQEGRTSCDCVSDLDQTLAMLGAGHFLLRIAVSRSAAMSGFEKK